MEEYPTRASSQERHGTDFAEVGVFWNGAMQNEGQPIPESREDSIAGEKRKEENDQNEWTLEQREQMPDQQPAELSETEITFCSVCNDLRRPKHDEIEYRNTPSQELNSAVRRGCPACSLITKGISEFCRSFSPENREIPNITNISHIEIILQRLETLTLRLQFHRPGGGSVNMLLEFFSTKCKLTPCKIVFCLLTIPSILHLASNKECCFSSRKAWHVHTGCQSYVLDRELQLQAFALQNFQPASPPNSHRRCWLFRELR
jgi:hypothetical protein